MKQMHKFASAALLAAAVAASVTPAQAEDKSWRMATPWSGGPWLERDAQDFANHVTSLSDGEIELQVFPGGTLGSALKVTETVESGVAQVSHNYLAYDYGKTPPQLCWPATQAA